MSGFEPMFMAEAFAAEAGTSALAAEVLAPELLASAAPEIMGGFGAEALGGLGSLTGLVGEGLGGGLGSLMGGAVESAVPTLAENLAASAPEALAQTQQAVLNAQAGANQVGGIQNLVNNAQGVNPLAQATYENTVPKMFQNALAGGTEQATSDALTRAAAEAAPMGSTNPLYNQLSNPLEFGKTGLTAPTDALRVGELPTNKLGYDLTSRAVEPSLIDSATQGAQPSIFDKAVDLVKKNPFSAASMGLNALQYLNKKDSGVPTAGEYSGPLSKFKYNKDVYQPSTLTPPAPAYSATYKDYRMAGGGPVEMMSNANAVGANTGYPMADINKGAYATPYQTPISRNVIAGTADTGVNPMTGEMAFAGGGIANLGAYSDGGRMLKGPGDGMSDNIPATIASKQPARLANEEFVIPADVVSHLGNGSSDAGAKQLYKMMDRVRQARTGKKAQGKQIKADKYLPA
jgi:hypothetical protein